MTDLRFVGGVVVDGLRGGGSGRGQRLRKVDHGKRRRYRRGRVGIATRPSMAAVLPRGRRSRRIRNRSSRIAGNRRFDVQRSAGRLATKFRRRRRFGIRRRFRCRRRFAGQQRCRQSLLLPPKLVCE